MSVLCLETITPLFLTGADPRGEPELRAASIRGALRFWLRALLGGVIGDRDLDGLLKRGKSTRTIEQDAQTIPQRLRALLDSAPDVVLPGARVVVDLRAFYQDTARLDELPHYIERAKGLAGEGNEVVLTGQAPIWMYLAIAHALHGKARRLLYASPVVGEVCIFDHTA
jgi:hypothetical protein